MQYGERQRPATFITDTEPKEKCLQENSHLNQEHPNITHLIG
jgi:hypothetical protein